MSSLELERLLEVLSERGIGLGRDDVAWVFESSKSREDMTKWTREYLGSATLLTKEELTFNESKAGSRVTETEGGSEISDEAFEIAISALEASTASIEKQCRLLEVQKRAIEDIVRRNASSSVDRDDRMQHSKGHTHEKAQLDFEQAELSESLRSRLEASTKQSQSLIDSMPSNVGKMFEKDDRLLDGLEKVIPHVLGSDVALDGIEEIDQLCQALAAQSSADIRSRIDTAYSTAAEKASAQTNGNHKDSDTQQMQRQRQALQSELDELCREIDGLSTMAVDNQYRNPITRMLHAAKENTEVEKATWSEYLSSVLNYLAARLDSLDGHSQHLYVHRSALKTVSAAFEGVLAASVDKKHTSQAGTPSPKKQSQKGLKPLKLVQANLSENQDPVVQLLRQFDVRVSGAANDAANLSESLSSAVRDQQAKLASSKSTSERGVAYQIAESLANVDADAQALLGAVFAPSEFGTVKLLNAGVQDDIDRLEAKTQRMGEDMRMFNVDEIAGTLREKQQALLQTLQ